MFLVTQYFYVKTLDLNYNRLRQVEIDYCLRKNIENEYISKIYLFCEDYPTIKSDKLVLIDYKERLTFDSFISFYNSNLNNTITILSNADIYFDETIKLLTNFYWSDNICITLLRYELTTPNTLYGVKGNLCKKYNTLCDSFVNFSQDTWIFKSKFINIKNCNFKLGIYGCDNCFLYALSKSNFIIYNCCFFINSYHYDNLSQDETGEKGLISSKGEKYNTKCVNYIEPIKYPPLICFKNKYKKNRFFNNQIIDYDYSIIKEVNIINFVKYILFYGEYIDGKYEIETNYKIIINNNIDYFNIINYNCVEHIYFYENKYDNITNLLIISLNNKKFHYKLMQFN